jgi:hypothetical protein
VQICSTTLRWLLIPAAAVLTPQGSPISAGRFTSTVRGAAHKHIAHAAQKPIVITGHKTRILTQYPLFLCIMSLSSTPISQWRPLKIENQK